MLSQDFDVDSFSHIRQSSLRQTHQTCWHLMATTSICVVDILEILYLSLHFSLRDMATCCFSSITVPEPSTTEQNPSSLPSEPRRRAYIPNKTILRRISPSRLTHYNQSTDCTSVRLFQSLSLPHHGNQLASKPPVPCPSECRIM